MAVFKCKICGGSLDISPEMTVGTCQYCGSVMTLPKLNDEKRASLYARATTYRLAGDYDRAMGIYENILGEDSSDAEAWWSLVLCKYGVEYVEDPATGKRVPTCNRTQTFSVFDDSDYREALTRAEGEARALYEEEAGVIDGIQKGILDISSREEPFDVFICYKETDDRGRRTPDSVTAQELYEELTGKGCKVFFSRITLEKKLGEAYEPYIYAALKSARVMVVLGTKPEYFEAVWVKNEWSRYLALVRAGAKKTLIPAYRDMEPGEMPPQFARLQAQNMSNLGFMQDLVRGILKILPKEEQPAGASLHGGAPGAYSAPAKLNIDEATQTLLGFSGPAGDRLFIPPGIKAIAPGAFQNTGGLLVVTFDFEKGQMREIPENAFAFCENLTTAMLCEKMASIGKGAFSGCRSLKYLNVPQYLQSIEEEAFNGCGALEVIALPGGFKSLGKRAFADCAGLTQAMFEDIESMGEGAFSGCGSLTNLFFHGENIRLPAIPRGAFADCVSLANIIFHTSVKTIEENAFAGCTGLRKLDFPESLRSIKKNAFAGCTRLRSVSLPDEFKNLEEGAFSGCAALESVSISGKAAVAPGAFEGCLKLKNITIGGKRIESLAWLAPFVEAGIRLVISNDIETLGDGAFRDCGFLMPIKLPDSLRRIGKDAFAGLTGMKEITIPREVTSIDEGAFSGCTGLEKVTFADDRNLHVIGDRAFAGCAALIRIEIPGAVVSIGPDAFAGCGKLKVIYITGRTAKFHTLKKITINHSGVSASREDFERVDRAAYTTVCIPQKAKKIDSRAFRFYSGIKTVEIPGKVEIIGRAAFEGCAALESIVFPKGLREIEEEAFQDCSSLAGLTLPENLNKIGERAFRNCGGLKSLVIPGGRLTIREEAFSGCTGIEEVNIPNKIVQRGHGIFMDCTGLKTITFPEDATVIDSKVCMGCTSLRRVVFSAPGEIHLGSQAFAGCTALEEVIFLNPGGRFSRVYYLDGNDTFADVFQDTPFLERSQRRSRGLCIHCGGRLSFFGKTCKSCGKKN